MLLNPHNYNHLDYDEGTRRLLLKTIGFFEQKGSNKIKDDDHARVWYADFLEFVKGEKLFATLLAPPGYGSADTRWDTWRNCACNEILAFYGLGYWYTWQVSILGLGPIWMTRNDALKRRAATLINDGAIFAFGLSEKEHGADLYATEMSLARAMDGTYRANGKKYYIGNANLAPMVSTFGKLSESGEFVFFVADYQRQNYECIKNITASQNYVAEFALRDYLVSQEDILATGQEAWDMALNTVNIGKFNLGWASIGICTHAFYEAISHAAKRRLYNIQVTDFPHVKQLFTDSYCRLAAMKLFALRASDYMRVASPTDRRYLLYNPVVKMKVTTQGESVINLLWDVIAAKGFEKDTYFEMAARDIRALPKLEGTVHVNIALIVKFMTNYFFKPAAYTEIARRDEPAHDAFLFNQGPTGGLGGIQFHDYLTVFKKFELPNVRIFLEQISIFKDLLARATPSREQSKDIDFLLCLGEIFTLTVYAQLILENASIYKISDDLTEQIFDVMIRDFSAFAVQLYGKPSNTAAQMDYCLKMIRRPQVDNDRYLRVWQNHVYALRDQYFMKA